MTRDANNGGAAATDAQPIAGGGQLDLGGQIARWVGVTLGVILLVVLVIFGLKKYRLVPVSDDPQMALNAQAMNGTAGRGFGMAPVFSNIAGRGRDNGALNSQLLAQSGIGAGGLQIVGAQALPGSGTFIYLIQIENHLVLLGASPAGGVRLLAEWEKDEQPAAEKENESFDSFLRQQGRAAVAPREDEEHTFASIRARLNSTADRLAGLRADFGA